MSDTPVSAPRGGCGQQAPFLLLIGGLLLACVAGPYIYFVRDYDYVQQTARDVQAVGVFTARALAGGLVALLVVAALAGLVAVWGLRVRWASAGALAAYERIETARAQHQVLPEGLTSMTVTHNHNQRLPAPVAASALVEAPGEQKVIDAEEAPPALPTPPATGAILPQLQAKGLITTGSLFVGLGEEAPARIDMQACGFVAIGGRSRSGKSTTAKLMLAQAVQLGWHIALCDPFPNKPDGLMSLCRPLSGHIERLAGTPEEIAQTIALVDKIGRRRMDGLDPQDRPLLLVIEEFTNVVIRQMLPAEILNLLPAMAMAYAAVGVHGVIVGHDFSRKLLGDDYGATLRRACTHRLAHRMAPDAAELLVPSAAYARQVAELRPGRVLFWGEDSPELVSVPELGAPDLVFAAAGAPPRPYPRQKGAPAAPRAPAPTASTAPAPPAAPPRASVPPTVQLASSVDEWIAEFLATEGGWHTADVIAKGIGANPGTLKNKLKKLADKGTVRRRGPDGGPYEYAAPTLVATA